MARVRIGICEWALPIPRPCGLKLAAEIGFEGVELEFRDHERGFPLSKGFVQKYYQEEGNRSNIEFPSLALNELDLFCMTGPEKSDEAHVAHQTIEKGLQTAHVMGIGLLQVPCFNRNDLGKQDPGRVSELFQGMCDWAIDREILIGVENDLPPRKMLELIKRVNRSNFRLYFDTQNYCLAGTASSTQVIEELFPSICEVHVKDGKAGQLSGSLLGEGDSGFHETIRMLCEKGYSGWLLIENYYDRGPLLSENSFSPELMRRDLKLLKETLSRKEQLQ